MADLQIEEITTSAGLEALAPAWQRLSGDRAPAATPFQSPAWLIPWWREIGGGELRVLVARARERMVGLLPMYLQQVATAANCCRSASRSRIIWTVFSRKAWPRALPRSCCGIWLSATTGSAASCTHCCAGSPLLAARVPAGLHDEILSFEPCLVLQIPAEARQLSEFLPSKIRGKLRYFRRRAELVGLVRFATATAATLSEFVESLFRLHDARWQRLDTQVCLLIR